jgi:putative membrane protein
MSANPNSPLPDSGYDPSYRQFGGVGPRRWGHRRKRHTAILIAAVVLILLAVALLVFILLVNNCTNGVLACPWHSGTPFFGLGILGAFLILMIGFWCIRIALWSTRGPRGRGGGGGNGPHPRDPAIVVARQRYARGEITREQFQQMVEDIRQSRR